MKNKMWQLAALSRKIQCKIPPSWLSKFFSHSGSENGGTVKKITLYLFFLQNLSKDKKEESADVEEVVVQS